MRALLSVFEEQKEEPPPPPAKERVQSALDAPRPELNEAAKSARVQSLTRAEAEAAKAVKPKRSVPQIGPTDTDEERELKRRIQAKEQEILDMASKLNQIAERLDRVIEKFHASTIGTSTDEPIAEPKDNRTKAFQELPDKGKDEVSAKGEDDNARKSTTATGGTSLEAILAAARSGKPRVKSETPKYSKLLRDLK